MQAVMRELREETSIQTARILACVDPWLVYEHPPHVGLQLDTLT